MGVQATQVAICCSGRHRRYVSESNYINNNMSCWYAQSLLFAGICFLKVSILFLIMRLKDERRLRYLLYGVISGLFISNFGSIFLLQSLPNARRRPYIGPVSVGRARTRGFAFTPSTAPWLEPPLRVGAHADSETAAIELRTLRQRGRCLAPDECP
ncbi:hypothetical protein TOPH_04369 [Tolypocladium ophioglossoides CBS 100239]|uniref:Uncharacterized protein n=1 Tax=Tolypocladium ophioglossoides (strain CBS 100239) TaxID=1163406 RepID=A0A0L0N9X4_TOLOC|nr:hypothetical protein TOPH_04369 [Tolypocladium ophioglossoides CBS 100239]